MKHPTSGDRRRGGERGYNLVVLAVIVTVMSVWLAAVLPLYSHQIQRANEAELIFRGLQYAEAIRVFQTRYNRYPNSLDELIEVEPRCIRQLWKNPLREDGRWGLIPVGMTPGQPGGQPPGNVANGLQGQNADGTPFGTGQGVDSDGDGEPDQNQGVILSRDRSDEFAPKTALPIRGVYAPKGGTATRLFLGDDDIGNWHFTVELISAMQQGTPDDPGFVRPFLASVIGKPWPPGVTPQIAQPSSQPAPPQRQGGTTPPPGSGLQGTQLDIRGSTNETPPTAPPQNQGVR